MSVSIAVAALAGLTANAVFKKIKMPGFLGRLLAGILPGHFE
jgi:Kef-type K+ transport system membrane component KefB